MADQTDAEKTAASDAQKKALKDLVKEAIGEVVAENAEKQRTTGRNVETPAKSGSIFEIFGF